MVLKNNRKRIAVIILAVVLFLLILVVLVQLFYPRDRMLPLTKIGETSVAGKTDDEIKALINKRLKSAKIKLKDGSYQEEKNLSELEAKLANDDAINELKDYSIGKRLIPFSIFFGKRVDSFATSFNDKKLDNFVKNFAKKRDKKAINAEFTINDDGVVAISKSHDGRKLNQGWLKSELFKTHYNVTKDNIFELKLETQKPKFHEDDFKKLKSQAEEAIKTPVQFQIPAGKIVDTSATDRAGWIKVVDGDSGKSKELVVEEVKFQEFANQHLRGLVDIKALPTIINKVDGREAGRRPGVAGKELDAPNLIKDTEKVLFSEDKILPIVVKTVVVKPQEQVNSSYSPTPAGLQFYYQELNAKNKNIKIYFKQIGGGGWSASVGASDSVVAASTYKLFAAWRMLDEINNGAANWQTNIGGTSVESCLDVTIVKSANSCVEQWLKHFGRSNINNFLYGRGVSRATTFANATATHTSANDLAAMLQKLQDGSIGNAELSQHLKGLMSRQIFRKGIPAGTRGSVTNKVGFLWDYLNDAAIVHHPRGDYILVIMTKSESWSKIAEITRKTESIIYP